MTYVGAFCAQETTGGYECICPSGWVGKDCGEERNECEEFQPCRNGATCVVSFVISGKILTITNSNLLRISLTTTSVNVLWDFMEWTVSMKWTPVSLSLVRMATAPQQRTAIAAAATRNTR